MCVEQILLQSITYYFTYHMDLDTSIYYHHHRHQHLDVVPHPLCQLGVHHKVMDMFLRPECQNSIDKKYDYSVFCWSWLLEVHVDNTFLSSSGWKRTFMFTMSNATFRFAKSVYGPFLCCHRHVYIGNVYVDNVMCIILTKKLHLVNSSLRLTTATRSAVHPAPWGSSWSELSNRLWWLKIKIMIGCAHYSQPYCGGQAKCPTCVLKIFHFASLHWISLHLFALICTGLHCSWNKFVFGPKWCSC